MIIKMVTEFKVTVVNFARPNQVHACAWIYRWTKNLWKIRVGPLDRGPLGRGSAFTKTRVRML